MYASRGRISLRAISLAVSTVAVVAAVAIAAGGAPPVGLQNAGFETAMQNWAMYSPVGDFVGQVSTEPSSSYTVYRLRDLTIEPREGTYMLRLGTPKQYNPPPPEVSSQPKGINQVSQTFVGDGQPIRISFRLFSWEFRGNDSLTIEIKDAPPTKKPVQYGTLEQSLTITYTNGTKKTFTKLPITITPVGSTSDELLDTGWQAITVSGVPAGKTVVLNYTLTTASDSGHATWAYFDYGNRLPVAGNNAYTTPEDTALSIAATGVLGNDSDQDGDPLIAVKASDPAHGTLTLNADGSFTYTPAENWNGADSFTYKTYDGKSFSTPATVRITVTPVNDPPGARNDAVATNEDTPVTFNARSNDTDVDGDASITGFTPASSGLVLLSQDGTFTYAPFEDFNGTDSFTYTLADSAYSSTGTVLITVNPVEDAPVTAANDYTTPEDTALTIGAPGVLLNDADPDADPLTADLVSQPSNGTLAFAADGSFTYTPKKDWCGVDSFEYRAYDAQLYSDPVAVSITVTPVNDPPVALGESYLTGEDVPLAFLGPGVLLNDTDPDADLLTAELVKPPLNGTVLLAADGGFTYTPKKDWSGTDSFQYRAYDNQAYSDPVTVTIAVGAVDDPPIPFIEWDETLPLEGQDQIVYGDLSSDPDPDDGLVSWEWFVTGPNFSDAFTGMNSYFMPPDNGTYTIELIVTDLDGTQASSSIEIEIEDSWSPANALNAEVVPNRTATLVARYVDPGWGDTHTASWDIPGATGSSVAEDNYAILSSGIATTSVTVGGSTTAAFTVEDNFGYSFIDTVTIEAIDPNSIASSYEPTNNSLTTAPRLSSDWTRLSAIQSAGDVDIYEVRMPDGSPLPAGAEVLASLGGLPSDYDLVVLTKPPAGADTGGLQTESFQESPSGDSGVEAAPYRGMPYRGMPYRGMPYRGMPYRGMPYRGMPYRGMPYRGMPYRGMGWGMIYGEEGIDGYPLSELSYTGLDGSNSAGTDIALSELGIEVPPDQTYLIAGYSANKGLVDEAVLASTEASGTKVYVAVIGANGSFSSEPYSLQLETSALGRADETEEPPVAPAAVVPEEDATDQTVTIVEPPQIPAGPTTLFVTQAQRYAALYGAEEWQSLEASLGAFCQNAQLPQIAGEVISLPSVLYDEWDKNPKDVELANVVAAGIKQIIDAKILASPNLKYVVFIGNDRIVPHYRVLDQTVIGNEALYSGNSFLWPDSPLYASLANKRILTDDYYTDAEPIAWQGRALYIPDLATSRLVETPAEVRRQLGVFEDTGGELDAVTSMVSGLDFFTDGANALADTFKAAGVTTDRTLVNDTWNADDLRSLLLDSPFDISSPNSHYMHFAALSAWGFANEDYTDLLQASDVANAGQALEGKLVFTIGCHAGFSVPDTDTVPVDPAMGIEPSLDFPQAMARQGAVFIGNTGFGLGDDTEVALSERIMGIYAADLLENGGSTVGDALVAAKQDYLLSLAAMTAYDEKSTIELVLYGLPQFKVNSSAGELAAMAGASGSGPAAAAFELLGALGLEGPLQFELTVTDGESIETTSPVLLRHDSEHGDYWSANGMTQNTVSRSIQPKIEIKPAASAERGPVHGVLITGAEYEDEELFDPVFDMVVTEWQTDPTELKTSPEGWWPSWITTLKTLPEKGQNLVVVPGQFKADPASAGADNVTGTERLYSALSVSLLRSTNDADWEPPVVDRVQIWHDTEDSSLVNVQVFASDPAGISRIVVLQTSGSGTISSTSTDTVDADAGSFLIPVPVPENVNAEDVNLTVQVADASGNIAISSGKGADLHVIGINAGPDKLLTFTSATTFTGTIENWASLPKPVFYMWDFGDGEGKAGILNDADVVVGDNLAAQFSVTHTYVWPQGYGGNLDYTASLTANDLLGGVSTDFVDLKYKASVASPDGESTYLTPEDTALAVNAPGVLANDTDFYGMPLLAGSAYLFDDVDNGTLVLSNGGFIYTPNLNYNGSDTFTYMAFDGEGFSAPAAVTISVTPVNDAPIVVDDYATVPQDATILIDAKLNDNAGPANELSQSLLMLSVGPALNGTASIEDGQVRYTPAPGFFGTDFFAYAVVDDGTTNGVAEAKSASGTVYVTVTEAIEKTTVYVKPYPDGNDDNEGTEASPFATVGHALVHVADGGTVFVAAGDYNESVAVTRTVTIDGDYSGSMATIVGRGYGSVIGVTGTTSSQPTVTIRGLRITGGGAIPGSESQGGGIRAIDSNVTVDMCTIRSNRAESGAGIYSENGPLYVSNTVIADNEAVMNTGPGGGVYVLGGGATLVNNTIANNVASGIAGGIASSGTTTHVFNSIIWQNAITGTGGTPEEPTSFWTVSDVNDLCSVNYCLTTGATPGMGNIGDWIGGPVFANEGAGDYTLAPGSPAIDAGAASYSWLFAAGYDRNRDPRPIGFGYDMGAYESPHGFDMQASGHNSEDFGTIGAKTKFDGSQGITLHAQSEIATASMPGTWLVQPGFQPATAPTAWVGQPVAVGDVTTMTTDWPFPTVNVFWQPGDTTAPAGAMFLNKDSVITCQDCHTNLDAAGPHGAADNWALDPDYPADYSYAELTKQVVQNDGTTAKFPAGIKLRSDFTTHTQTYTDGRNVICAKCHDLENYQSGTTMLSPLPLISTGSGTFVHNAETYTPYLGGRSHAWTVWTDKNGNKIEASDPATSTGIAHSQAATGTINLNAIGASNTAHGSHHQDQTDGSAQCVNCHIGLPHGWKAPRLLVNTGTYGARGGSGAQVGGDEAPYLDPDHLGTSRAQNNVWMSSSDWNKIGMLTLSAVDDHHLIAGAQLENDAESGTQVNTGAAYWSEPSCQACNDHNGEDGIRILEETPPHAP